MITEGFRRIGVAWGALVSEYGGVERSAVL